jgi:hypothetical protein
VSPLLKSLGYSGGNSIPTFGHERTACDACVHTLPLIRPEHALHSMSVGGFTLALANSNFVAVHGRGTATP